MPAYVGRNQNLKDLKVRGPPEGPATLACWSVRLWWELKNLKDLKWAYRIRFSIILHYSKYFHSDSGRELTFNVSSPTHLDELTFRKNGEGSQGQRGVASEPVNYVGVISTMVTPVLILGSGPRYAFWLEIFFAVF